MASLPDPLQKTLPERALLTLNTRGILSLFLILLPLLWFVFHVWTNLNQKDLRWKEAYTTLLYRDSVQELINQLWLESEGKGNESRVKDNFKNIFKWEPALIATRFNKMATSQQIFMPVLEEWKNIKSKSIFWDKKQKREAYYNLIRPLIKQLDTIDALSFLDQGLLVESFAILQESDPLYLLKERFGADSKGNLPFKGLWTMSNLQAIFSLKVEEINSAVKRIASVPENNPLREQLVQALNFYSRALENSAELLENALDDESFEFLDSLWANLIPPWRQAEKILMQWVAEEHAARKMRWRYIFGTTFFLLISGLASVYLLWRTIFKRMQKLTQQLEKNVLFNREERLSELPLDEVGYVGKLINEMIAKKTRVQENSSALIDYLRDSSSAFIETFEQQKSNLLSQEQIAKQVGLAAEEISAQTRELVLSAEYLGTVIQESAALAQGERLELSELELVIRRLLKASKEIEQLLQRLNQETIEVASETSSLITLTDQSYLLALNTSIEASRGSESGSGFSVIAQEIHRLADQAAEVTLEIEGRFKTITNTFISNSQQIESFSIDINAGEVHSARLRERLTQLLDKVQIINGAFERMQKGVGGQVMDAESIGKMAGALTKVTQEALKLIHQFQEKTQQFSDNLNRF